MLELSDCTFYGHALPEPFVRFELEGRLSKAGLLARGSGAEAKRLQEQWEPYRRALRSLGSFGGSAHVLNHVIAPLAGPLGYTSLERQEAVETREGEEDGGWLLGGAAGAISLRAFSFDLGTDLDAPGRRGRAYRFSPGRVAQRVLLARGERAALLTNGLQLRLVLCDPARPESHIGLRLDRGSGGWAARTQTPDSFRLLLGLASPGGLALLPELVEAARLNQTAVTKNLRKQARAAIEGFIQAVMDRPENAERLSDDDRQALARELWREGLILVYRILFTLKLEASADPARAFSFASTTLWRNTFSPNAALGPVARAVLKEHADTGRLLEDGLRTMFRLFSRGISSSELRINALGGALFGEGTTPLLDSLRWGELAVAKLLVALLWTEGKEGEQRVHYGTLDIEDLGRVHESLLELEPGVSSEAMCRLRRQKLEVVVPLAQGDPYREKVKSLPEASGEHDGDEDSEVDEEADDEGPRHGKKTKVQWIEAIPAGRFFLRVGLGRKATGAFYTPHPFVRFLVQETLGPQVAERSPAAEPNPDAILKLKVLDPAMGSGHFLVEACRFLGEKLYEACRLCDELAVNAEEAADKASADSERAASHDRAIALRARVEVLPDPDNEMLAYLPSRVPEGESAGLSQSRALAFARRLVAVHCLYGVDKNPLAVELAKLALWLESYAEGLPLTFLDHRLKCGDSLTGPSFENLLTFPGSGANVEGLFATGLKESLISTLDAVLSHVRDLEGSVGKDVADLEAKLAAKHRLDQALAPFRMLAAAWSGGVMLGPEACDDVAYLELLKAVAERRDTHETASTSNELASMIDTAQDSLAYDLQFPEVFLSESRGTKGGFDAVLGNPPWDAIQPKIREFLGGYDLRILDAPTKRERQPLETAIRNQPAVEGAFQRYLDGFERQKRIYAALFPNQKIVVNDDLAGRQSDAFRVFVERFWQLVGRSAGRIGALIPGGFHINAGAVGVRRLLVDHCGLRSLHAFVNTRQLFEISPGQKFDVVVAERCDRQDNVFKAAFGLEGPESLFGETRLETMEYPFELLRQNGGDYLTIAEFQSQVDLEVLRSCTTRAQSFGALTKGQQVEFGRECETAGDSWRFRDTSAVMMGHVDPRRIPAPGLRGALILYEKGVIAAFDSAAGPIPRYCVDIATLVDKPAWLTAARYYRLLFRAKIHASEQRKAVACVIPPGGTFGHNCGGERRPQDSTNAAKLSLLSLMNSFVFEFLLRQRMERDVTLFILNSIPTPRFEEAASLRLICHSALRLSANVPSLEPLWREQLAGVWRESSPSMHWPAVEDEDARWGLRAAAEAVVTDAYGLTRTQYAYVLSTFTHKSYPKAANLCLVAFDELKAVGLEEFAKKHDPYWDLPLNESLAKPIIDIPVPAASAEQLGLALDSEPVGGGGGRGKPGARSRKASR